MLYVAILAMQKVAAVLGRRSSYLVKKIITGKLDSMERNLHPDEGSKPS